jgi:diguanylate cyclase (GGDEF)-like protein
MMLMAAGYVMPLSSFVSLSEEINALSEREDARREEQRLQAMEEENALLHAVIDNFPGGLQLIDKNLRLVYCNKVLREMLEYPPNLFAFGNPSLEQLFHFNALRGEYGPGNVEDQVRKRMELVKLREPHVYQRSRPNGMILEIRGVPLAGGGFMTTYLDITAQSRQPASKDQADIDPLTGLPKITSIMQQLERLLANLRHGQVAALHCIDLDHFRAINKHYGKAGGDQILREIGARLKGLLRGNDPVARIGGDRFLVLQQDVKRPLDVARLANRIMLEINRSTQLGSELVSVSSTIGFALAPRDGYDAKQLFEKAEGALLALKQRDRGTFDAGSAEWMGSTVPAVAED